MKKLHIFPILFALSLGFLTPAAVFAQFDAVDAASPSDVEILHAIPGDSFVSLEWDKSTDDIGVTGYKVYYGTQSVTNENTVKYDKNIDAGNELQYIIGGLQNGETYYFAVTAYDKAGNESNYFSPEVYATPMSGLVGALTALPQDQGNKAVTGDAAPNESKTLKLNKAEAIDSITVKLTFDAGIQIPEKDLESFFYIVDNNTLEELKVTGVASGIIMPDGQESEVFLTTDVQIPETEYLVTIGNALKGKNNEIVVSGSGDTALFRGSAAEHVLSNADAVKPEIDEKASADVIADESKPSAPAKTDVKTDAAQEKLLELKSVTSTDETTVKAVFNKAVVLSSDPTTNFAIIEKNAPDKTLEIKEINLSDDKTTVTIKTAMPENKIYLFTAKDVADESGNKILDDMSKMEYAPLLPDTTPPEDVTNFVAEIIKNIIAKLTWIPSINSAKDLVDQILYKSLNKGESYAKLKSLGPNAATYNTTNLVPGKEYYFKLTVKDKVGNESVGAVTSVTVPALPATGPAGIMILALGSIGAGLMRKFRKAKR